MQQPPNKITKFWQELSGKNGHNDHSRPILVDQVNALVFWSLPNISHSGEG